MIERRRLMRFLKKIQMGSVDECWPWLGSTTPNGYGHLSFDGRMRQATHVMFYVAHSRWPDPQVNHQCDNPICCNPAHLYEGTQKENLADRSERGRAPTGEKHWTRKKPERLARGEHHGSRNFPRPRKISLEDYRKIYDEHRSGTTQAQIAARLKVSKQLISKIVQACELSPGLERP